MTLQPAPVPELKSQKIFQVRNGMLHCLRCDTWEALSAPQDWLRTAEIHHAFFHGATALKRLHGVLSSRNHECSSHCYEHFYEGDV